MITIRFSGRVPSPRQTVIGMETDQRSETLRFLLPQVTDDQQAWLMIVLPDGTVDEIRITDEMVLLPGRITEIPGRSRAWVEILSLNDTVAWNSEIFYLDVGDLPPISERTEQQYPTAIQEALAAVERAQGYTEAARKMARFILACNALVNIREEERTLIIQRLNLTDDNAFQLARLNGYTGSEEEWDAELEVITGNASAIEQAIQLATEAKAIAEDAQDTADNVAEDVAGMHGSESVPVDAEAWEGSGPYTATVECSIATADNVLVVGIDATNMDATLYGIVAAAKIQCTAQDEGEITLTAFGEKPTEDITVNVLGVNL